MCDKSVDCYTCPTIATCAQVSAAFGPTPCRQNGRPCAVPNCQNERASHSKYCLECRREQGRKGQVFKNYKWRAGRAA